MKKIIGALTKHATSDKSIVWPFAKNDTHQIKKKKEKVKFTENVHSSMDHSTSFIWTEWVFWFIHHKWFVFFHSFMQFLINKLTESARSLLWLRSNKLSMHKSCLCTIPIAQSINVQRLTTCCNAIYKRTKNERKIHKQNALNSSVEMKPGNFSLFCFFTLRIQQLPIKQKKNYYCLAFTWSPGNWVSKLFGTKKLSYAIAKNNNNKNS